jgi:uncharacterized protein (TIGR00299 family) protein
MPIAYFDCSSGIAGDMVLGAFLDLGLPVSILKSGLKKVELGRYELEVDAVRKPFRGVNLHVRAPESKSCLMHRDIDRMLKSSSLGKTARETARAIFNTLAVAEGRVHGVSPDEVHFHEVGAVDSIIDIVGTSIALDHFGFDVVFASPLPFSRGTVNTMHGTLPVPPPAVMELIKGIPLEPVSVKGEMVTPTGAAILATVCESFGECPIQRVDKIGSGFGDRRIEGIANALRVIVGEGFPAVEIETNIDDMNPEIFDHVIGELFDAGAVDVGLSAMQMKKNRPATKVTAIAPWQKKDAVIGAMFRETSSFGVRYWPCERKVLTRELIVKKVAGGKVSFKAGYDQGGRIVKVVPEHESVKAFAKRQKKSLIDAYREAEAIACNIMKKLSRQKS